MQILMVEDDRDLADTLRIGLESAEYGVTVAGTAEDALNLIQTTTFDLMLLDVELPGQDGFQFLRSIRETGNSMPVIIMSGGRKSLDDRLHGLDHGADDYLLKPFDFKELLSRVRAVMRRAAGGDALMLRVADLELDLPARRVTRGGKTIDLTQREFELLEYLARRPNQVVTRDMLAREVWKEAHRATSLDNVIDVHISHLRRKIDDGFDPPLVQTIRGKGFSLRH